MDIRFRWVVFQTAMLWLLVSVGVPAEPSMKPFYEHWEMVADSNLVAKVKFHVPLTALKDSTAPMEYGYVQLIEEPIKGHFPARPMPIKFDTDPCEYQLAVTFLGAINDQEVIMFQHAWTNEADFIDQGPDLVLPFSSEAFSQIEDEVKNQAEIAEHFEGLPVGKATEEDAKVRKLFDGLTREDTQKEAWEQLLRLSRQDVPTIVRLLNDSRRMPDFGAPIPNLQADSAEKFHYFRVGSVFEAASLLLQKLTFESFDLNGWRVWCAYHS